MALIVAILAVAAAGCGGGEVSADEVPGPAPALTVPTDGDLGGGGSNAAEDAGSNTDENGADTPDGTATPEPTTPPATDDTSGGAAVPEATAAPDTAANDTPPDAGSPPEQFEDFCEQNAGAC